MGPTLPSHMDENGEKLVPQAHAKLAKQNNNQQHVYQKL